MIDRRFVTGLVMALAVAALAAAPAFAQQENPGQPQDQPKPEGKQDKKKKKDQGPLGLPTAATLKEKIGLTDEQVTKVNELYDSYKDKVKEAMKKAKEAADKKAAKKELEPLRSEILGKLRELCTDEQKPKLDELVAPPKKKKKEGQQ